MTTSAEPQVTVQTALNLGITEDEFRSIVDIMGRTPNFNEISIFSVMWSEHCSYKNSILWLKTLPRDGGRLLTSAGEKNAGFVDIGEGLACAFKIESHNQASAIEPSPGAATGLVGKVYFNDCYNQNILINAMSVGIVKVGETVSAAAGEPGNPVFIVGSATGKDSIHGATFASTDLTENSAEDLPSVQAGDPFQENFLLEAIKTGAIVGMQDTGAAGITCAAAEMCTRSEVGMRIDLDKAPTLRQGMKAWEILLSESRERMLIAAKKGMEHLLLEVFEKWDIECTQIGEVIEGGSLEYYQHGEKVADVPAHALVQGGGAPVYKRDYRRPSYMDKIAEFRPNKLATPTDWPATARQLMASPNVVSKRRIYEQYDSMARPGILNSDSDAAVVRIPGSPKALALTTNCNPAYVYADPYVGAMIAVAEAARNIVCAGGEPAAITNCLHFGNPHNPEAYYQFVHAIKGMGEACRKFGTPVTGSNVSFYNQSEFQDRTEPVYPRPIIGMVGILDDATKQMTFSFKSAGDHIYMVGSPSNDINSSEYLRVVHGVQYSPAPHFDIDEEYALQQAIQSLIKNGVIRSAHGVSEGGLLAALTECAIASGLGFSVETDSNFRKDAYLFGEYQSRVIVTVDTAREDDLVNYLNGNNVPFSMLGQVQGDRLDIDGQDFGPIADWSSFYNNRLGEMMEG